MSAEIPAFKWFGREYGLNFQPLEVLSVTQIEMLHDHVEKVSEKIDKVGEENHSLSVKVGNDIHLLSISVTALTMQIAALELSQKDHKILLETLSDNMKFWRKIRRVAYGILVFVAAYAIGWMDFFKNSFK